MAVSHSDSPSGNEYSNLLLLREVLNHMLSSKQAYMVWWIFGLRGKECGRKENKVVQKNRRESKEKTEVKYVQEMQSCKMHYEKWRN